MPKTIATIDLTAETAPSRRETFTDAAIVGTAAEQPPDAEFGEVNRYSSSADVADDYGDGSGVYEASQNIEERGATSWRVMVLEAVEEADETVADGEELANSPVLGNHEVSSPDGDVAFTTDDPPNHEEVDAEIVINPMTGEVSTSVADASLTYYHADWTQLHNFPDDVNLLGVADTRFEVRHVGVLDETQTFASGQDMGMVANGPNVNEYDDVDEAMAVAHEVAGAVPSGDLMMIVDGSSADLAASQLGELAVNQPHYNPFWNELPLGQPITDNVGDPGTENTFEGGDVDGNGPVNALISVDGVNRLSNALTTAGAGSDFPFFDIRRTMVYTRDQVEAELEGLQTQNDQIPFTDDGQAMLEDAIKGALEPLTGTINEPLAEYEVRVPEWDDEEVDRENRIWGGIEITARLAGSAHEFTLGLRVTA